MVESNICSSGFPSSGFPLDGRLLIRFTSLMDPWQITISFLGITIIQLHVVKLVQLFELKFRLCPPSRPLHDH